jgi:hypothetical protein
VHCASCASTDAGRRGALCVVKDAVLTIHAVAEEQEEVLLLALLQQRWNLRHRPS